MKVLRELNAMPLIDVFYDISQQAYPDLIPERPIDPPEPKEVSLDLAEKRLRNSLKQLSRSPYWDDYVRIFFDEITQDEQSTIVSNMVESRVSNLSPASFAMTAVRERAYRICAQMYVDELGAP